MLVLMKELKRVLLLDPSIATFNVGDKIISQSVREHLKPILDFSFIVEASTHLPVTMYLKNIFYSYDFDYRFVCGSNLIRGKMNSIMKLWDVNLRSASIISPLILIGVGWWKKGDTPNAYSRALYSKLLDKKRLHSVRDNYTLGQFQSMGFKKIINTSCPTMWKLTNDHTQDIPHSKAKDVVTTLTDYDKNPVADQQMINILSKKYRKVYLWLQGVNDFNYASLMHLPENVELINPILEDYDNILASDDIEYVGTRLHAGIRALQKKKRTIIVAVDHRALEKKKDFNLTVLDRNDVHLLEGMIDDTFKTEINLPLENIKAWKNQFNEE
jgi:polysaccharide pyruvyl transferase WcaK-like protein